jgi:hypothetical protein
MPRRFPAAGKGIGLEPSTAQGAGAHGLQAVLNLSAQALQLPGAAFSRLASRSQPAVQAGQFLK